MGGQCVVTVAFSPTAESDASTYSAAVSLAYSDALGPVLPDASRNVEGSTRVLPP